MAEAYVNELFPVDISYGSIGGPKWSTSIVETDGGHETRIARLDQPRWYYKIAYGISDMAAMQTVYDFWLRRRGALEAFPFKDWADYSSAANHRSAPAATDQVIGIGDGTTTTFQLIKTYPAAVGESLVRTISKPVEDTVLIALDGVAQVEGVDFTIDYLTGELVFTPAPSVGEVVTSGFEFYVPVRFDAGQDEILEVSLDDVDTASVENIRLVSVAETAAVSPSRNWGGSEERSIASDLTINPTQAAVWVIDATETGLAVILPDPDDFPSGRDHLVVFNDGAEDFDIETHDGQVITTLTTNTSIEFSISKSVDGDKVWYGR